MINIAVCDDESIVTSEIFRFLTRFRPQYSISCFDSGEKLLKSEICFDIIFLDIEMPGINGMEAAKQIERKKNHTYLIFLTNHTEYMQDAFKVRAYRFLGKPIIESDIMESIVHAENEILCNNKLVAAFNEKTTLLNLSDVAYMEAFGDGAIIYTASEACESNKSLKYWEESLGNELFYRVHKSYLVSFRHILRFDATSITLKQTKQSIPISRRKQPAFKQAFLAYIKKYAKYV